MSDERMHWEDYEVGWGGETYGRTITQADIVNFAGVSGDFHPAHVDREYATAAGYYPENIAHGILGLSAVTGLLARDAPETIGTRFSGVAFVGVDWRFKAAILANDTIQVQYEVKDKRRTKKPERGIVVWELTVRNQRREVVHEGTLTMMVATRGPAG